MSNKIFKNLDEIKKGIYINKYDPNYYKKFLHFFTGNTEYMLQVAEKYESENNFKSANKMYEAVLDKNRFSIKAQEGYKRTNKLLLSSINPPQKKKKPLLVFLIFPCIIFLTFISSFFLTRIYKIFHSDFTVYREGIFNVRSFHEAEPDVTGDTIKKNINVETVNEDEVIKLLIREGENERRKGGGRCIEITAYHAGEPYAVLYWPVGKEGDIFFLKSKVKKFSTGQLFLSTLSNAFSNFIQHEGFVPDSLNDLTANYPKNYLSYIPPEPTSGSNAVYSKLNGKGGWAYLKPKDINNAYNSLEGVIVPNISVPYKSAGALSILITPESMYLMGNDIIIKKYPIASGKKNPFNEGEILFVDKRLIDKMPNSMFGTRILGLNRDNLAVHGTNDESSIGTKSTLGCLRMYNKDIEDLYPLIPLFTPVKCQSSPPDGSGEGMLKYYEGYGEIPPKDNIEKTNESPDLKISWK